MVLTSPAYVKLWGVHFPTASVGYAVGNYGTILATKDGGLNWADQSANLAGGRITKNIAGVHFPTPEVGYAVPYTYGGGVYHNEVIKTLDGGATWTLLLEWVGSSSQPKMAEKPGPSIANTGQE
jgi:photosystem II stability/assembly factor-like uncharacterized protein